MTTHSDSHAHLSAPPLLNEIDAILTRAQSAGIKAIVNICTNASCIQEGLEISKRYPWVYHAAGVHPHDAQQEGEAFLPIVESFARQRTFVAIGEIGLDYHYHHSAPSIQQEFLRKQLRLALELQLPVIIHCREAFEDLFRILDEEYVDAPGVLHCFTGTIADAHRVLERGWYLSFSGIVTFKKSIELKEVVKMVPSDRLLVETDSPYLAPQSKRGKQNEPANVVETTEVLAAIRNVPASDLAQLSYRNLCNFLINDKLRE